MGNIFKISMSCDAMATRCWDDCIRGRAMYICKLEENLAALQTAFQELKEIRDDVATRVNFAEQQQLRRPLNQVQGWLSRVATVENEVDGLIRDGPQEVKKLCPGSCCSKTCKSTYKFGKMVAQKLERVNALKSQGSFEDVAERVPASVGDVRPTEPAVGLESTFDKVWSCLQDEEMGIVGLYGIGGVGKTTLLTQINNKLLSTPNDFDVVIWVVVSKDLKVEKIQEDVGKKIGLLDELWGSKNRDEKAIDIFRVLSQKKFILLLDDIWEWIDLTEVGIPHPNIQNGSKVLFTTRSEEVCYQMNARKKVRVECLAWEKAWELFQEKVGEETLSSDSNIPKLAETVAEECDGLPLALITTGRAMAGKRRPQQWKHAIEVLRKNAAEFSGMEDKVFPILKFSYDNIHNDKVRSCFLYCALFPEDYEINKADLIEYWICEGFLDGYDDRREAENEGYDSIDTLVRASLLEEDHIGVKMHDVIRDLALWIASEYGKVKSNYLVKTGAQLNEAPDVREWELVRRMSLMRNRIKKLTKTPKCPNLLTLFLRDNHLKIIAGEFFQFMPSLRVLDLSDNNDLKELPLGISKLVSLECLDLSGTGIQQLPDELKTLANLKYLNLENTKELNRFPHKFISSFSKLEALRMFNSSKAVAESNNELLVEELLCLKHLKKLSIDVISNSALQRFLSFQKLQSCTRGLKCILNGVEQLNVSSLANMKHLEDFELGSCESLQELKIDWTSEGREMHVQNDLHKSVILSGRCFDSLFYVILSNCPKLGDLTWLIILAPNLFSLWVTDCDKMEEIISVEKLGQVPEVAGNLNPFAKIKWLRLWDLPEFKSIYRTALPFPHLSAINVRNCPKLKKLPLNSNSAKERNIGIVGEEHWWNELEWEDEATYMAFLPCFISTS